MHGAQPIKILLSMFKHQGSSEQSGSYTNLSSFLWLNKTLCGITWQFTLYFEKKKILVQRRRSFSLSLFPFHLARNKENVNIESRILIGCAFVSLQESRILSSIIFTPSPSFLIPFVIIKAEFWQDILIMFKPRLVQWLLFFQPVRILRKLCLKLTFNSCWVRHSWISN